MGLKCFNIAPEKLHPLKPANFKRDWNENNVSIKKKDKNILYLKKIIMIS